LALDAGAKKRFFIFVNGNLFSLDITCVCGSLVV
jgi:hypothetical protein